MDDNVKPLTIPIGVKNKIRSKFRKKVKKGLSYITIGKQVNEMINRIKMLERENYVLREIIKQWRDTRYVSADLLDKTNKYLNSK